MGSNILDDICDDLGVGPVQPETPEEKLYLELTANGLDRHQKIGNIIYWLKCELSVYSTILSKSWIVAKPSKDGRVQVGTREVARTLLEHYFYMMYQPRFKHPEARPEMMHKLIDMEKFLDMFMSEPRIETMVKNPKALV